MRRDAEQETALAGRDQEAARAAEERVAETEAEISETRRGLRASRAEAEGLRRELERERERAEAAEAAVRRGRVTEIGGEPINGLEDDDFQAPLGPPPGEPDADRTERIAPPGDEGTARFRAGPRGGEPAGPAIERDKRSNGADAEASPDAATEIATLERPETVEGSPGETVRVLGARRPRRTGTGPPADAAPGTAAIGARHIEPGQTPQRSALAAWIARVVAFLALTVVVVALLMVLKPF